MEGVTSKGLGCGRSPQALRYPCGAVSTPQSPDTPRRRTGVTFQELPDGSAVLVDESTGSTYALNATAAQAWQLCDGQRTLDDIADALLDKYEATPEQVVETLQSFVAHLREIGVLE